MAVRKFLATLGLLAVPPLGLGYAFEVATKARRDPVTTPPLRGEQIRR